MLYEWENDEVLRLEYLIEQKMPRRESVDGVYWRGFGNFFFLVKFVVAKVYESYAPILFKPIINTIWQKFIPPRAQLTIRLTNLEKLKTGDFLVEKGIIDSQ